ncbi:exosortase Q [Lampropedia aestuarii]|uniref:Exosortase Q n=1 Tax=Lampropedia aestuarii TaxID=2562762 RepID=A0A4S5BPP5_9BURK|nr:exosortase Q [Lampropedia aestuarii]THJ31748.1 exosortase Q [Lampropedia aestuarii]
MSYPLATPAQLVQAANAWQESPPERSLQGAIVQAVVAAMLIALRLAPAAYLLAMMAVALWPQWQWLAARMQDGSDNPLGLLAAAALLGLALWHAPSALRQPLRLRWLVCAGALFVLAVLSQHQLPALASALLALLSVVCLWLAVRPSTLAALPIMGLTVLALPLIASLQFYAGYPLRVAVAEVSRWLLVPFFNVSRTGAALQVDGQWILVDAACSGVQMAWWGYATACISALLLQLTNRRFVLRLPLVGLLVLVGNIARNAVLVALQADGQVLAFWLHEGIGLLALLLVCLGIWWHMAQGSQTQGATCLAPAPQRANPYQASSIAIVLAIGSLAAWSQLGNSAQSTTTVPHSASPSYLEAPSHWQGERLRPLALSAVEARFAQQFPGRIERLTNGTDTLIWRHVQQPTRMLHPAADCFRAMGYRISQEQLSDKDGQVWRCFIAEINGQRFKVCEIIQNADGQHFSDTSAWYWAALLGQSQGPWQAWTVVSAL